MKEMEQKFITSTLLIITFLIVSITGVMLMEFFDISKATHEMLKQLHIVSGIIFMIIVVIHFVYNYKLYKAEAKIFFK